MQWENIFDLCKPFPNVSDFQVNKSLKILNYSVDDMFELSDRFYQSLGMLQVDILYCILFLNLL